MFIVILLISFPEKELKADGEEVSACGDVGNFTWTYDNGFLFCSDNKDMVLEAYEEEDSVNAGRVRMAARTEAIAQRWRILNEYEDEDVEFRPAFAFGGHKMDSWRSWGTTKRTCKKLQTDGSDLTFSNIDIKDIEWKRPEEIAQIVSEKNESPKFVPNFYIDAQLKSRGIHFHNLRPIHLYIGGGDQIMIIICSSEFYCGSNI